MPLRLPAIKWPVLHRGYGLGILIVGIAGGQELLTRAAQHHLEPIDYGFAALAMATTLRALYQQPPTSGLPTTTETQP